MVKDRVTYTLDCELIDHIDKEMKRNGQRNKSKFIEFVLRNALLNPHQRLKLLEKSREHQLIKFKMLNDEILRMQEHVALLDQAKAKLEPRKEILKKTGVKDDEDDEDDD